MTLHHHSDRPWRVRVDDVEGTPCGAGVLLDSRHVLTCAHVVRYAAPGSIADGVRIHSVTSSPEWSRTAKVAAGTWVHDHDTQRGDVALLELDEPVDHATPVTLWKAPLSAGLVTVYGFPRTAPFGMGVEALLAGSGHKRGEWGLLKRVGEGAPWIERGYSGAGVMAVGGEFDGRVIGIVVAEYLGDDDARAAWMLPTETILTYLPRIEEFTGGDRTDELGSSRGELSGAEVLGDPLRLALTRELTRLLDSGWSGTAVVGTGGTTAVGDSWLVRLVRTADPAARATVSDAELTGAPGGTVLGFGAIDAAYDACGKSVADVSAYLVGRFGLPGGEPREVAEQLRRRTPAACLVVGGVDRAQDPRALTDELLNPLAEHARRRGLRLILGFDGTPPSGLASHVRLDPEPLHGDTGRRVTAAEAQSAVERLAREEDAASAWEERAGRFFGTRRLPPRAAPRLRVRLAVARTAEPCPELAVIHERADEARAELSRFTRDLRRSLATWKELAIRLELHRGRAARHFGAEDPGLAERHAPAARALRTEPVDLRAAAELVRCYVDAVDGRLEER